MSDEQIRQVLGLLLQQDTREAFAALVLGTGGELPPKALAKLAAGGLAVREEDGWRVRSERFRELLKELAEPAPALDPEERVLRAFLVDGRLTGIPARREKRLAVLRYVARVFEPGVRYPEKDVDVALRAFHDDHAALRRHLIDEDLLSREGGFYWRSGGPFDL